MEALHLGVGPPEGQGKRQPAQLQAEGRKLHVHPRYRAVRRRRLHHEFDPSAMTDSHRACACANQLAAPSQQAAHVSIKAGCAQSIWQMDTHLCWRDNAGDAQHAVNRGGKLERCQVVHGAAVRLDHLKHALWPQHRVRLMILLPLIEIESIGML